MSGPVGKHPDERARSQTGQVKVGDWIKLPASGYAGEIPEWPLSEPPALRVEVVWLMLWRTPMAAVWQQTPETIRDVALYAVYSVASEDVGCDGTVKMQYVRLSDRLGCNPLARLRLRWIVEDDSKVATADGPTGGSRPGAVRRLIRLEDEPGEATA